jgi:hypothetical protein
VLVEGQVVRDGSSPVLYGAERVMMSVGHCGRFR